MSGSEKVLLFLQGVRLTLGKKGDGWPYSGDGDAIDKARSLGCQVGMDSDVMYKARSLGPPKKKPHLKNPLKMYLKTLKTLSSGQI